MAEISHPSPRYTRFEDFQGLLVSAIGGAFGMMLLGAAGLITGGTAGLALMISYLSGFGFGWVFFVINLPFYWFAWTRRGMVFTLKTFLSVAAVSLLVEILPSGANFSYLHPGLAALLFGAIGGVGVLGLFRHGSSLGGVGIVALILQDRFGFRAGWTQMIWDLCLFAAAAFLLPLDLVIWSLIGSVILNIVIAMNHRRDWYLPG
ncbi:YitT family protein [Falsigemmobacter faecalis]|uniref:YitT family protein n=1 Tax=Falsigemmobacter faecalis TaxID=2488730 RepID=A0A3P3DSC5_9RHOB|nr:YitT family protein [Falsigemmobacter faecalis]RRH76442.1 YitT family protein [Falsigemmobacter faecalis]